MAGEQAGNDPMEGAAAQLDAMNSADNTAAFQKMGNVASDKGLDMSITDAARKVVEGPYSGASTDTVAAAGFSSEPAPVQEGVHPAEYSGASTDEVAQLVQGKPGELQAAKAAYATDSSTAAATSEYADGKATADAQALWDSTATGTTKVANTGPDYMMPAGEINMPSLDNTPDPQLRAALGVSMPSSPQQGEIAKADPNSQDEFRPLPPQTPAQ